MTLYEQSPKDLQSQIQHYKLLRKENVLQYYARKEGYTRLGLQYLPALKVSEHQAKQAIKMSLVLESLANSQYADEEWTLNDTSADLFSSPPPNCFKKGSYEVTVWFDQDPENAFPYISWSYIYYQDENEQWHKVKGKVDYNGLYFDELNGDRTYYILFEKDSGRYGNTGTWTVNYQNQQILPSVTSSTRRSIPGSPEKQRGESDTSKTQKKTGGGTIQQEESGPSSTTGAPESGRRRRRGEQQGERPSKRRRGAQGNGTSDFVSPREVGKNHRSLPRTGLGRIERLKEEAKDPPILIIKGCSNSLKCWRYRCNQKSDKYYTYISTVFKWLGHDSDLEESRLLVAFENVDQRTAFMKNVTLPKNASMSIGSLETL